MPELNTTSTADISFILLVFFLVMTSMDVDKGLTRTLPPLDDGSKTEAVEVAKDNALTVSLGADNRLTVDGKPMGVDRLRARVMAFVRGTADRNRHMILLDVDRKASYDAYFNVQNEIVAAYNQLRDAYSRKKFGRQYSLCTPEQREEARAHYPQRITESSAAGEKGGAR